MALEVDLEACVGWAASGAVCRRGTRGPEFQSPDPSLHGHPGSRLGHLVSLHRPRQVQLLWNWQESPPALVCPPHLRRTEWILSSAFSGKQDQPEEGTGQMALPLSSVRTASSGPSGSAFPRSFSVAGPGRSARLQLLRQLLQRGNVWPGLLGLE